MADRLQQIVDYGEASAAATSANEALQIDLNSLGPDAIMEASDDEFDALAARAEFALAALSRLVASIDNLRSSK